MLKSSIRLLTILLVLAPLPALADDGRDVLDAYLTKLRDYYPASPLQDKDPVKIGRETEQYWNMADRGARSAQGRSLSTFSMYRFTDWHIDKYDESGDSAEATVSLSIGNQNMLMMGRGKTTKSADYSLVKKQGKWVIDDFGMGF